MAIVLSLLSLCLGALLCRSIVRGIGFCLLVQLAAEECASVKMARPQIAGRSPS